jgi:glutamine synthetase
MALSADRHPPYLGVVGLGRVLVDGTRVAEFGCARTPLRRRLAELTLAETKTAANLLDAIEELERDPVLREAFGRGCNEDCVDYYARVKHDE